MPELAEVEYIRRQWDAGLRQKIVAVSLHAEKRLFRGVDLDLLQKKFVGATYLDSEARAKQMLFRFSKGLWLGVHLGMTGHLRVEPPDFAPGKHDHLALHQKKQTLVFQDPRLFGRVRVEESEEMPAWWTELPPAIGSSEWSEERLATFLRRRARLAVKAALLVQTAFPGVGNWMADEILWRAGIDPRRLCGQLSAAQISTIWRETRDVCRIALETVAVDYSDPPADWLFHQRWSKEGCCPKHQIPLETATVGGRTTRWCKRCQPSGGVRGKR